jgi:hypothetical protein
MSTKLVDLFKSTSRSSPLQKATQAAARQAGWTPPWDVGEKRNHATQSTAGLLSGLTRGLLRDWRRTIVLEAHKRLKLQYRVNPYADAPITALIDEYHHLVIEGCKGNRLARPGDDFISYLPALLSDLPTSRQEALKNVGRDTLIKDMKALGIRSKRRKPRIG